MELNDAISTFDTLYTTNEIQILKLALPLLSASIRPYAATLIKMKELRYCLDQLPHSRIQKFSIELDELDTFIDNALPYCNPSQRELFSQIKNIKSSMKMFEKMQCMMSLMGDDATMDPGDMFKAFQSFSSFADVSDIIKTASTDNMQSEHVQSDSTQSDHVQSDSKQSDHVQSDPVQSDPMQYDPVQSVPVQSDSVQFDRLQSDPEQSEHMQFVSTQSMYSDKMKEQTNSNNQNTFHLDNIPNAKVDKTASKKASTGSSLDIMLQSALSEEQKAMFNMFKSKFDSDS